MDTERALENVYYAMDGAFLWEGMYLMGEGQCFIGENRLTRSAAYTRMSYELDRPEHWIDSSGWHHFQVGEYRWSFVISQLELKWIAGSHDNLLQVFAMKADQLLPAGWRLWFPNTEERKLQQ